MTTLVLVNLNPDPDPTPGEAPPAVAVAWQASAACLGLDPELFFPAQGESTREAKEVCAGCAVRTECLEHALTTGEKFGIWGGMSERDRRRLRRERPTSTGFGPSAEATKPLPVKPRPPSNAHGVNDVAAG